MQVFIIIHTAVNILEQCTQGNVIVQWYKDRQTGDYSKHGWGTYSNPSYCSGSSDGYICMSGSI